MMRKALVIAALTAWAAFAQGPAAVGLPGPGVSSTGGTCAGLAGDVTGTCGANTLNSSGVAIPNGSTATTQALTDKTAKPATDAFAQSLVASLNQAVSVQAATVTTLPANTYANGTAGVGATLTGNSNGALAAIDGYTASVGDRILVNNEATASHNGVYTVTTLGNGGTPYVLTRATDFNTVTAINGSGAIPVLNGTQNNNTLWVLRTTISAIGTGAPTAAINYDLGTGTPFPSIQITNAASTGTTLNKLVKLTGAPSTAVITATSDTSGAVGICGGTCGTSGSATILQTNQVACVFDGATTAGDYVVISSSTAGDCHDGGASITAITGQIVGRVMTTNAAGGTFTVLLFSPDVAASALSKTLTNTHVFVGNASNVATDVAMSGDCTMANTGAITCTGVQTANQKLRSIGTSFTGNGSALSGTATKCRVIPSSGTIQSVYTSAQASGSLTVAVRTTGSYTGTAGFSGYTDIVNGGTAPSLSSAVSYTDSTLTSWLKTLTAGQYLCVQTSSPTTVADVDVIFTYAAN